MNRTSQKLSYDEPKKIRSQFDEMVIGVLKCIVDGQRMTLIDADGRTWKSKAKCIGTEAGNLLLTTITRDDEKVASITYDCELDEESVTYF